MHYLIYNRSVNEVVGVAQTLEYAGKIIADCLDESSYFINDFLIYEERETKISISVSLN